MCKPEEHVCVFRSIHDVSVDMKVLNVFGFSKTDMKAVNHLITVSDHNRINEQAQTVNKIKQPYYM